MDYSSVNVSLWNVIIQLGIVAIVIMLSNLLRRRVRPMRDSLMPTAVIGGFLLLALRSTGLVEIDVAFMEMLVYHGIALGFIAMALRSQALGGAGNRGAGAKSGAIIVGSYLIQAIVGLIISIALAYTVMPNMFKAAGILLPMGFGQGPGQANNVGATYEAAGFVGGHSFALSIAASGFICACVVGVAMLNILASRGKIVRARPGEISGSMSIDSFQDKGEVPVSESVDRFSIQFALVLIVYLATYLATLGLTRLITYLAGDGAATVNTLLWGFNFIIGSVLGFLVKFILVKLRKSRVITRQYQNNYLLNRISGLFFDLMVVAGIAAIDLRKLSGLWLPFALFTVAGAVVTWFFLAAVSRKVYKEYYYEGLLSMYGMMTGTISSGVLLLREIDPELKTPAAGNLVSGSAFAIIFGAPMLVLIGMAYKSVTMTFVTLGLCVVYFALLVLFIYRSGAKSAGGSPGGGGISGK
jgi:ESS family glutamate:Na+ symporter